MMKELPYLKSVLMCVTCKNISLFVDWLTELTAYSDSIVVFPLSFTFSSSVTQFLTVTATEEIWCNAGFTHYTIVHSAGDSDSGAQRATRKTKKRPTTHTIFHYTTHKAQCVTLNLCRSRSSVFSGYAAHTNTTLKWMLCSASSHSFTLSLTAGW